MTGESYSVEDLQKNINQHSFSDPEKTYTQSKSVKDLYLLIDFLLENFQYEKAASYYVELMKQTDDRDRSRLMKILINDLDPSPQLYPQLQWFLSSYVKSGAISAEDAIYYGFALELLQDKFKKEDINVLTWKYTAFKNKLREQHDLFYTYKDAPDYYLKALFAIAYFKQQEFGVAKALAEDAIAKNPNYILPYQIKSYVALLSQQYDNAISSLDILVQIDPEKQERYQFLLWLVYYHKHENNKASDYFTQTKSPRLRKEGLRYLIQINNGATGSVAPVWGISESDKKVVSYLEELFSNTTGLIDLDYQTVFDRYVYDRLRIGTGGMVWIKKLYTQYPDVFDTALASCTGALKEQWFICDYGKAGKMLIDGKVKQAVQLLIPLVKKYPQWQTYYIIWLLYKEQGLSENAKLYFAKALEYIDAPDQKRKLSEMMLELLNERVN